MPGGQAGLPPGEMLVRRLAGFSPLDDADATLLHAVATGARWVRAGADLAGERYASDNLTVILDGFAGCYSLRASGARQITEFFLPGDVCDLGSTALARMNQGLAALSPCRIARPTPTVFARLRQRPALAHVLQLAGLAREATARAWLVNLGRRDTLERLAHLFCELHARVAAVGLVADLGFALPLTQADLADGLGVTSVHINRSLQELRRRDLIVLQGRHLTLPDLPRLQALAEFNPAYLHLHGDGTGPPDRRGHDPH